MEKKYGGHSSPSLSSLYFLFCFIPLSFFIPGNGERRNSGDKWADSGSKIKQADDHLDTHHAETHIQHAKKGVQITLMYNWEMHVNMLAKIIYLVGIQFRGSIYRAQSYSHWEMLFASALVKFHFSGDGATAQWLGRPWGGSQVKFLTASPYV